MLYELYLNKPVMYIYFGMACRYQLYLWRLNWMVYSHLDLKSTNKDTIGSATVALL